MTPSLQLTDLVCLLSVCMLVALAGCGNPEKKFNGVWMSSEPMNFFGTELHQFIKIDSGVLSMVNIGLNDDFMVEYYGVKDTEMSFVEGDTPYYTFVGFDDGERYKMQIEPSGKLCISYDDGLGDEGDVFFERVDDNEWDDFLVAAETAINNYNAE